MSEDKTIRDHFEKPSAIIHICGPGDTCPHEWDGPEVKSEDGSITSLTCSKCGMDAYTHSLWMAP
jgi:hypothetical protein